MDIKSQLSNYRLQIADYQNKVYTKGVEHYQQRLYQPTLLSVFLNPFFIVRRTLFNSLKRYAPDLKGILLDFGSGSKPYQNLFAYADYYVGVQIGGNNMISDDKSIDIQYDGKQLLFENEYFDSLFCNESLILFSKPDEILSDLNRVLKPEALALFSIPFVWQEKSDKQDFVRYTTEGAKTLLERNGFEIIKTEQTSNFVGVVFQLLTAYLQNHIYSRRRRWNLLVNLLFIFPFNALGFLYSKIFPKNHHLYFHTIILAKKSVKPVV